MASIIPGRIFGRSDFFAPPNPQKQAFEIDMGGIAGLAVAN